MNTLKLINKGKVRMIAHRGLSGIEPENTLAAFIAAGNRSFWGIETDLHRTKDGKYIIMHDFNTERMTGQNYTISETNFDVLRNLIIKEKDGTIGRIDLHMPTLEEYMLVCQKYEKKAVLELKDDFPKEQLLEILDIIKTIGYLDDTVFISFNNDNLYRLKEIDENLVCQSLLNWPAGEECIRNLASRNIGMDIVYTRITEDDIKLAKELGVDVNVWFIDDVDKCMEFVNLGVDYITTNLVE